MKTKKLKNALATMGFANIICGFTAIGVAVNDWDFSAMPWAVLVVVLGMVCLEIVGAFDW